MLQKYKILFRILCLVCLSKGLDNEVNREEYVDDPDDSDEVEDNTEDNVGVRQSSAGDETVAITDKETVAITDKETVAIIDKETDAITDKETVAISDKETVTTGTGNAANLHNTFKAPAGSINNKKRKASKMEVVQNQMDQAFKILKTVAEKPAKPDNSQKDQKDQCTLYTELLCTKLKALDGSVREIAMLEIDNLLFHIKMQHQSNVTSVCGPNSSNSLQSYSNNYPRPSMQSYHQQPYRGNFQYQQHAQENLRYNLHIQPSSGCPSPSSSHSSEKISDSPSPAPSPYSQPSPSYTHPFSDCTSPVDTLTSDKTSQNVDETIFYGLN